jgi:hypothetical protein
VPTFLPTACISTLGLAVLALSGCSTPIAGSVVQSNLAQEEAANQLLVLNIARAHERMPMHFSQMGQIRSGPAGWSLGVPSIGLDLPFGGAAESKFGLTLGAEGQTPVDVTPLNGQEFMRGMTKAIDPELLNFFAKQGWPSAMLMHLFIESVDIVDAKGRVTDRLVNNPGSRSFGRFEGFVKAAATCDLALGVKSSTNFYSSMESRISAADGAAAKAASLVVLDVDGEGNETDKREKKVGVRLAEVSDARAVRLVAPPKDAGDLAQEWRRAQVPADGGAKVNDCLTGPKINGLGQFPTDVPEQEKQDMAARNPKLAELLAKLSPVQELRYKAAESTLARRRDANAKAGKEEPEPEFELQFVTRAPQSILYYLGELSRVQNGGWGKPLTIDLPGNSRGILFQMKNSTVEGQPAVAVKYGGQTFWVPKAKGGAPGSTEVQDRSVMTLSLMTLMLGLQDKGTEAPRISNVRVLR